MLHETISQARNKARAEVAEMVEKAKARAAANAATLAARLDKNLAESEARIEEARAAALGAIKPVSEATAASIITRLTGAPPADAALSARVDEALAARKAA
jgi:F-type H+-transporting ATPase subunit b